MLYADHSSISAHCCTLDTFGACQTFRSAGPTVYVCAYVSRRYKLGIQHEIEYVPEAHIACCKLPWHQFALSRI